MRYVLLLLVSSCSGVGIPDSGIMKLRPACTDYDSCQERVRDACDPYEGHIISLDHDDNTTLIQCNKYAKRQN